LGGVWGGGVFIGGVGSNKIVEHLNLFIFIMQPISTTILLGFLSITTLMAQKDTSFYNANGQKVENRALSAYFKVITVKNALEIQEEFYTSGAKRSYSMNKKLPVARDTMVVVGFEIVKPQTSTIPEPQIPDSAMVKHGSFMEWYETGETKIRGNYFAGKLQGDLETFYPNKTRKRQDNYQKDSLKTGHCFDISGKEIAHFPFSSPPQYKQGTQAMFKFLGKNISYPRTARENNIQGMVYSRFTVDSEGKIKNIYFGKGDNAQLAAEATRVIQLMSNWIPATQDGEKIESNHILPIKFKLGR
jgi:TonB family protein